MKAIKRTVAALLATLMLATSTSFTLAAENYTDDEAVVVAKVNAAGIMTGTDKGFEPSKSLTRAEAAAIIVRMKGIKESAVKAMAGTTLFKDVAAAHWASGYVNQASQLGIVKGVSATEFAPDREVTVAEFATMAIRALGAGAMVDAEGTWPTNYVNFANEEGILNDVTAVYTAVATRMNAATIVANTLEADMWKKDKVTTNGEVTWEKKEGTTILSDTLKIYEMKDQAAHSFDLSERKITLQVGIDDSATPAVPVYFDFEVADGVDLSGLKAGIAYDYWVNDDDEIVGFWKAEESKITTVTFDEIVKTSADTITLSIDGSDKKYDLHKNSAAAPVVDTVVYYNNVKTASAAATFGVNTNGDSTDNDYTNVDALAFAATGDETVFGTAVINDKKVTKLYINKYEKIAVVDEVTSTRVRFNNNVTKTSNLAFASATLKLDDEDVTYSITKDGKEIKLEDLEEDDVVLYFIDTKSATDPIYNMVVITNTVEGEVTAKGSNYIKIDGKKYEVEAGLVSSMPSTEDEIIAYLNDANKVIAYDDIESAGKYAVISSLEVVNGKKGLTVEVKLAYFDGTESETLTVDFDDDDNKYTNKVDDMVTLVTGTNADSNSDGYDDNSGLSNAEHAIAIGAKKNAEEYNLAVKAGNSVLGSLVNYEISKDDVVIKAYEDVLDVVTGKTAKVTKGTKTYFTTTDATPANYYVTGSTKVMILKPYSDAKDYYRLKAEIVDVDDLKTNTTALPFTFADFDDSNVGLVLGTSVKKASKDSTWYYVTDKASVTGDYDYEIEAISGDGKVVSFFTDLADSTLDIDTFGVFELDGEEVTGLHSDSSKYADQLDSSKTYYLVNTDNGILNLAYNVNSSTYAYSKADFVLAENVLFIKEKDGKYSVGKESEIEEVVTYNNGTSDVVETDYADASEIIGVITYTKDDVCEVVAIIYNK